MGRSLHPNMSPAFQGVLRTVGLFATAGVAELGGAYLIWRWLRTGGSPIWGLLGVAALAIYGIIQTTQVFSFGRTFASYGGVFITLALLWGWLIDGMQPDRWDWLGVALCLVGVSIILWMPRS